MSKQPKRQHAGIPKLQAPIRNRLTRAFLLVTMATILVLSFLTFSVARVLVEQRTLAELNAVASSREDRIASLLETERQQTASAASESDARSAAVGNISALKNLFADLQRDQILARGVSVFTARGVHIATEGIESPLPYTGAQVLPTIDRFGRWKGTNVYAPVRDAEHRTMGILAIHFDPSSLAEAFRETATRGTQGGMIMGWQKGTSLLGYTFLPRTGELFVQDFGSMDRQSSIGNPLAHAVRGDEGAGRSTVLRGDALVAFRHMPSLGWGLAVTMDRAEAFSGIRRLAIAVAGMGLALLLSVYLVSSNLAASITQPLSFLAERVLHVRPGHWEFRSTVHTGDEVEVLSDVISDLTGRLQRTYEHLEDIVQERTQELRREYALDRAVLASIQHGIVVTDGKGVITEVNPAASALLGWATKDLIGQHAHERLQCRSHKGALHSEEHPLAQCLRRRAVYRPPVDRHVSIARKDQTFLPVALIAAPLLTGKRLFGAILVFQDVTEERQIDYMKSEFISLASHQLRTPLSALRWYVELLESDGTKHFSDLERSYVEEISHATRRMTNLLDALLRVARLEGSALTPQKLSMDFVVFLRETAEELCLLAKEAKLSCEVNVPHRTIKVSTDPVLLRIVLQNLFSNAVKYTKSGGIRISCAPHQRSVDIIISDSGVGIPRSEWGRVFQKFFRARNVREMDTDGSGLGLYLAKTIVTNLGGKITFTSVEGKGTRFTVTLPKNA